MTFSFQFSVANFWTKSFCRSLHKHIYVMPPCTTHSPWQIPIIYLLHNEKQVSANDLARTGKPQPQSRKKILEFPQITANNEMGVARKTQTRKQNLRPHPNQCFETPKVQASIWKITKLPILLVQNVYFIYHQSIIENIINVLPYNWYPDARCTVTHTAL